MTAPIIFSLLEEQFNDIVHLTNNSQEIYDATLRKFKGTDDISLAKKIL